MYNPFEEEIETSKTGKEFKRVTDLLISLDGKMRSSWVEMLLENAYEFYSGTKPKSEIEILHERLWMKPIVLCDDYPEEIPTENPIDSLIPEETDPEIEKLFPNPFDAINSMNNNLNNRKNKNEKNVKQRLTKSK